MAAPKKKSTSKSKTSTKKVVERDLTLLDYHAIQLHELFQSFKRAGFDHGTAITLIGDSGLRPDWFKVPKLDNFNEWDELEDDED
jgi:hypothetical protein